MSETRKTFTDLLKDYRENIPFSREDENLFWNYLNDRENMEILKRTIDMDLKIAEDGTLKPEKQREILEALYRKLNIPWENGKRKLLRRKNWQWKYGWAAVLVIGIFLTSVAFLFQNRKSVRKIAVIQHPTQIKKQIVPGTNGAVLTLANGRQIVLDSMPNGMINVSGNDRAVLSDGHLAYKNPPSNAAVTYNTISTPRGRQYQVQLSDGSKVWLNAASSIRFPTAFSGNERVVEITGEAYFEVVHNAQMPFRVKAGNQLIEDLGTSFDVKAYDDEPTVRTTLVEGIVRVSSALQKVLLKPGEQAKMVLGKLAVNRVDVGEVIAWKNGFFAFDNADLGNIMRQLSRWYNVRIEYQNTADNQRFSGKIDRSLQLSDVLSGLQFSKAHFKIDENNRKIIVLP